MEKYHTVIIGAGPAGYSAALKIAASGKSTCLIERSEQDLGGTCLNRGCIPVKSFIESANLYQRIISASNFGLQAKVEEVELSKIETYVNKNIIKLKKGLRSLLASKGVETHFGLATFTAPKRIEVKGSESCKKVEADNYILATGSKPKDLGSLKIDNRYIFNSDGFCHNPKLGDNILIIGGGYIGCELASFYNSLGAKVTIIDIASTLLPGKDKDLVKTLAREFSKRGIEVLTAHKLKAADVDDGKVKITAEDLNGGRELSRKFSLAIVAVGREANFANLNLAATAVAEDKGFIKVDSNFCASASGIYAIGDLINTPMLAHIAYKEAAAVTDFILRGKTPSIDYGLTPEVIFSQPQLATFGLSETQASEKDIEVEVRKSFFRTNAKAHIAGEPAGFAKLILDRDNQQLLGASIVGAEATELIHTLIAIANSGQSAEVAKKIIYAHPTLSEVFSSDI